MSDVPWGYLGVVLVAWAGAATALWPRPTHGPRATPTFVLGSASSEVPQIFLLFLVASTVLASLSGDLDAPAGLVVAGIAAGAAAGLVRVLVVGFAAERTVVEAVDATLDTAVDAACAVDPRPVPALRPMERLRTLVAPLSWPSPDIQVIRDLSYGPYGRANTLDVFRRRGGMVDAPVLVHLHGGGYSSGLKSREARLLMQVLARRGWLCVSANYRLAPTARFPDILTDAKRVIAWARTEGPAYGAGRTVVACGGSAGANLAVTAALTACRSDLQPGFEHVDTGVQAVVCLYGYYGPAPSEGMPSAPTDHLHRDAPPTLVVHGALDPMVAVADARAFVKRLRAASASPVAYAEVAGMLHAFDRFDSVRHGAVSVGVLHFLDRLGLTPDEP